MPPDAALTPDTTGPSTPPPLSAIGELRQNRWVAAAGGTTMLGYWPWQHCTVKIVPVSAFSGRPPSAGGLKRGSRHVPVQLEVGSMSALACVSLYDTSVRYAVPLPSMLASQRVFQNTSLPLKKARCMPAPRAASTLARCGPDQYSSWPTERKALWLFGSSSVAPARSVSTPLM